MNIQLMDYFYVLKLVQTVEFTENTMTTFSEQTSPNAAQLHYNKQSLIGREKMRWR